MSISQLSSSTQTGLIPNVLVGYSSTGNNAIQVNASGIVLGGNLLTTHRYVTIGDAGLSSTNPNGLQVISPIDMNSNDITNVDTISSTTGSNLTLSSIDNAIINSTGIQLNASDFVTITATNDNISFTANDNISFTADDDISLTSVAKGIILNAGTGDGGNNDITLTTIASTLIGNINLNSAGAINLTSGDGMTLTTQNNIDLNSTSDAINLNANLDISLTAVQGFINLNSTNDEININANLDINLNSNAVNVNSAEIGYNISPQLTITNSNSTAGITNGVPAVSFYKNGRNADNNDKIGDFYFNANDTTSTKREWARMEIVTRNVTIGNEDGSISFFASLNGVSTEFLRINGADGDNNFLRPLDMNGSAILSTSGSLSISASGSSGAGTITLTPKPLGNLIFQNLPTSVGGLPTGAVWNNSGVLSIAP